MLIRVKHAFQGSNFNVKLIEMNTWLPAITWILAPSYTGDDGIRNIVCGAFEYGSVSTDQNHTNKGFRMIYR